VSGAATLNSLTVSGAATLNSLTVSGATTLNTLTTNALATLNTLTVNNTTTLSGNVGIKVSPSGTYSLDVVGTIHASGDVIASSDKRIKTNIIQIDSALSTIQQLRGVSYSLVDDPSITKIGLIAQEVEKVIPEVVHTDTSIDKMKSIAYGNIVAILIEGIKELSSTVQGMRSSKSFA
jgi:hypothetical protein